MTLLSATYDPADNKLRLYAVHRLDDETFTRVKAAGFIWAPKQELFVAPMWTPKREDLLIELCGEIDDEDKTLVERAEERAERFEDYSGKRLSECESKQSSAQKMAQIMNGQPVLVGHHSEKRHRKDLERMSDNMRAASRLWDTARYWERRAQGAIRNAAYKERPDVRARRIKTLEADNRKYQRELASAAESKRLWSGVLELTDSEKKLQRALLIANNDPGCESLTWNRLQKGELSPDSAATDTIARSDARIANAQRWLSHFANRLTYERAILQASGYTPPVRKKALKSTVPLLNYRSAAITAHSEYRSEGMILEQVELTAAEWKLKPSDFKSTMLAFDKSHKVRTMMNGFKGVFAVFITDSKEHPKPETST